jgi:CcmD family protein
MLQPADTSTTVLNPLVAQAATEQPPVGIERTMLAEDKLPVVLAVVLVVWIGIALLLLRTDRRLARLERRLDEREGA